MRLRSVALAAVAATPLVARAQPRAFVGATQSYAVFGCGTGIVGGPPTAFGPTLCVRGTATVGTVALAPGVLPYQVLYDVALERQAGFTPAVRFASGANTYRFVSARTNLLVDGYQDPYFGPTALTDARLTAWPLLTIPGSDIVAGSLELTGGNLIFEYRDPGSTETVSTTLLLSVSAVPEPSTFVLAGVGGLALAGVGAARRRRVLAR